MTEGENQLQQIDLPVTVDRGDASRILAHLRDGERFELVMDGGKVPDLKEDIEYQFETGERATEYTDACKEWSADGE